MSLAIENCKGHVHVFSDSGEGGRTSGFYALEPPIPDTEGSKALVLGIPLQFQEIVQPTVTLDDKRALYVFGTAWNDVSVAGILLLGDASTRGAMLGSLIDWYNENRVGVRHKHGGGDPVRVSMGTAGFDAYVTGLTLGAANPQFNTQQFNIKLLTADIK
tara:strand:- start:2745 stop:3224 length:480 start_codon:yes stop_codon:yes gene_type:complete